MKVFRSVLLGALALTVAGAAALPASASEGAAPGGREKVRRDLEQLTGNGAVGAQVRVTGPDGTWQDRAGTARAGHHAPVPQNGVFRVGSATKMFTATVLLQLVGEGRLSLDDPIDRHLPKGLVPRGERITVRMLLQHTSGLHDLARDLPQGGELYASRFRHYDRAAQVRGAVAKPAEFPPGTRYAYSNTNYVIAGLIAERVTGRPYGQEVRDRVITPLGLRHTSVPGDSPAVPGPHAHGYVRFHEGGRQRQADISALNPSMANAAGEILSTTSDLDRLLTALTSGKLLRPAQWREMNRTVPTGDPEARYGLGLKRLTLSCGRTVVGHTGGIPGYATLAFTTPDGSHRVQMSANLADWPADSGVGEPIDAVLEDAVCG